MDYQSAAVRPRAKTTGTARLSEYLSKGLRPATILLGIYFILSIAIRLSLPDALTLDEAEQSLFSQYWLAGYGTQPPFYNWVQNVFVDILGISLISLTLPKFTILLLCYVFMGLAARETGRSPAFVAMAMLSLLTLPQVSYMPQQDLTHTVALLMASAFFIYGLCRVLSRNGWRDYALMGLAIGVGTISKYNFVLLPAAAALAVFCDGEWRQRLFDPRILLTAIVGLLVVLPHGVWLIGHVDAATKGSLAKMVEDDAPERIFRILGAFGSLLVACLAFGALTVVILATVFRKHLIPSLRTGDRWTRLFGLTMLFSLAGVVLVIVVTGATSISERWLNPYLLLLPLYLLLKFESAGADVGGKLKRLVPFFLVIMVTTLIPLGAGVLTGGMTGIHLRINYPMADAAQRLKVEGKPTAIVAAGMHLAGNMRLQFPGVPVIDADHPMDAFPLPATIKGPVLAVWISDGSASSPPPFSFSSLDALGLTKSPAQTLSLPYRHSDGRAQFHLSYQWLH